MDLEMVRKKELVILRHWFTKSATSSQGIGGYICEVAALKFTFFLIKRINSAGDKAGLWIVLLTDKVVVVCQV